LPRDLRSHGALSGVAGYCVTPIVVRCEVAGEEAFTRLVSRIGRVVVEALDDVARFDTLVAGLGVPRDPRHNPIFQTMLAVSPPLMSPADDWSLHLMEPEVYDAAGCSKFDISIELDKRPEGHVAGRFVQSAALAWLVVTSTGPTSMRAGLATIRSTSAGGSIEPAIAAGFCPTGGYSTSAATTTNSRSAASA
jgi:hypothetical protein